LSCKFKIILSFKKYVSILIKLNYSIVEGGRIIQGNTCNKKKSLIVILVNVSEFNNIKMYQIPNSILMLPRIGKL